MKEWITLTEAEKQAEIDKLILEYRRKKRLVERLLAEMRMTRKQIDLWEDALVVHTMKRREENFSEKELLHG